MRKIIFLITVFFASFFGFAQDGSLDFGFSVSEEISPASKIVFDKDGKILVIQPGFVNGPGTYSPSTLKRFNYDGSLDLNFNVVTATNGGSITDAAIQEDGRIVLVGDFQQLNGIDYNCLSRLNADGSIDNGFDSHTEIDYPNAYLVSVAIQPDGRILVGGRFDSYKGASREGLTRLNNNGSLDNSFTTEVTVPFTNTYITHLLVQKDGKILVGGESYFAQAKIITRLNSNGSKDSGFIGPFLDMQCGFGCPFYSMFLEKDNKIIIGGVFQVFSEASLIELKGSNMARLNSDGTTDVCFYKDDDTSDNSSIYPNAIQSDGKILVLGNFPDYRGTTIKNMARLYNDGSVDATFNIGEGPNGPIRGSYLQYDGKIVIVGEFTEFNGLQRKHIARLNNVTLSSNEFKMNGITMYPNPVKEILYLNLPYEISIKGFEIYDSLGKKVSTNLLSNNQINVAELSSGVYLLKIKTDSGIYTDKFLKK